MAKAMWNGVVLAESDKTELVEGNLYFPPDSVRREFFRESEAKTVCGWKGTANYFDIIVGDKTNPQAAWFYPDPTEAAAAIKDHVAFWKGVQVSP